MEVAPRRFKFPRSDLVIPLAVILAGLLGRAAVDKIIALRAGPDFVALWAQLQSVAELVAGVAMAGVGQGLTVLVAQATAEGVRRRLLRAALVSGLGVSAVAAFILALGADSIAAWVTGGAIVPGLVIFAVVAGWLSVVSGMLTSFWLGCGQRDRILWLSIASTLVTVAAAYLAAADSIATTLLATGVCVSLVIGAVMLAWLAKDQTVAAHGAEVKRLSRYMVAGLSVGILSPVSVLVARRTLSDSLSWADAGVVQAIWRSSEWITVVAAGMLWLIVLPRLSAAHRGPRFFPVLGKAIAVTLSATAVLLLLLWLNQKAVLEILYDARFVVSNRAAALFFLGDWLRVGSWIFMYALFAMQRTVSIAVGEVLSVPLFAALLILFRDGMDLERAGLIYCVSYVAYLAFMAAATLRGRDDRRPGDGSISP